MEIIDWRGKLTVRRVLVERKRIRVGERVIVVDPLIALENVQIWDIQRRLNEEGQIEEQIGSRNGRGEQELGIVNKEERKNRRRKQTRKQTSIEKATDIRTSSAQATQNTACDTPPVSNVGRCSNPHLHPPLSPPTWQAHSPSNDPVARAALGRNTPPSERTAAVRKCCQLSKSSPIHHLSPPSPPHSPHSEVRHRPCHIALPPSAQVAPTPSSHTPRRSFVA